MLIRYQYPYPYPLIRLFVYSFIRASMMEAADSPRKMNP